MYNDCTQKAIVCYMLPKILECFPEIPESLYCYPCNQPSTCFCFMWKQFSWLLNLMTDQCFIEWYGSGSCTVYNGNNFISFRDVYCASWNYTHGTYFLTSLCYFVNIIAYPDQFSPIVLRIFCFSLSITIRVKISLESPCTRTYTTCMPVSHKRLSLFTYQPGLLGNTVYFCVVVSWCFAIDCIRLCSLCKLIL